MTTLERLIKVFTQVFEDELELSGLKPESELIADLGMNSIGMLYMALALEEEFGIHFTNEDFPHLRTVQDVIDRVERG